jgi:monoterpene epsilon-lactone hydrolase
LASFSAEQSIRARLPLLRLLEGYLPLRATRWLTRQGARALPLPAGVRREAVPACGVPCEWIMPAGAPADQVILYLHGGGFVLGVTPQHPRMVAYLVQKTGARTLMVDYRLAPEHPFPAALDDCVAAYLWLLERGIPAQKIVVAGDSAGGNLTVTTLMKLRDGGEPMPAAAACLSPVGVLTAGRDAAEVRRDPVLHPRAMKVYDSSYVGDSDPHDSLISPLFGDWHGLPPLLIHAGEDEILRDDAVRMAVAAKAAGVDTRLEVYARMWHVWQLNLALPQARHSLDDIAQFLAAHLAATSPPVWHGQTAPATPEPPARPRPAPTASAPGSPAR